MTNTTAAQIARKLSPAMRAAMLAGNTADHARGQAASGPTNTLAALVTRELVYPGPGSSLAWTPLGREVARVLDPTVQTLDEVHAEALGIDAEITALRAELKGTAPGVRWADGVPCDHAAKRRDCEWCNPRAISELIDESRRAAAPNGTTSINGVAFPAGSEIEVTTVSGSTYVGTVGHMFPAGFVLHTADGEREIGNASITGVRPIISDADCVLADQAATRPAPAGRAPEVSGRWAGIESTGDEQALRAELDAAHEQANAENAARVTIAWRDNATRKTYARSIVDPVEFKQTARAIEAYDNLTRIMTRPELREWLRLRVADPADLPYFVKHLFGASEDELDEDYAAICGPMA